MLITIAQLNYTIGDVAGNVLKMIEAATKASADGAELVVFSELSLTGYYPGDLLEEPAFLEQVTYGLASLQLASKQFPTLHWMVGAPVERTGPGKPLENALLVIKNGEIVLRYAKQLLPTYNIFDDRRHFEPGPDVVSVLRIGNARIGVMICEDGWNDDGVEYAINPFARLADAATDLIISINASPSNIGKREQRHQVFSKACRRIDTPLLYVNQIGGQDQVIYDGASFAVEADGNVTFEAQRFVEDVRTIRLEGGRFTEVSGDHLPRVAVKGIDTMAFYRAQIVLGIRDYARRCGFRSAVVGSSGGIDSALTLALGVEALGAENIHAITMPSVYSSAGSVDDSVTLCRNLGISLETHPIADIVTAFSAQFERTFGQAIGGLPLENLQPRVRGTVLMEASNTFGHLLLTTGNKSEISVGSCTLYGDTNGGLGPIGDLCKTEFFALCRHINETAGRVIIPQAVIDEEPSAGLAPGRRDSGGRR